MVGLKKRDITKNILIIFLMCYEYSLNFTNMLKLYKISKKYFWTFFEICNPMLKIGTRKATNMRKSVEKILPYAQALAIDTPDLTPREDKILQSFSWFVQDSFSDGDGCLHVSQLMNLPFIKGYRKDGSVVTSDASSLDKNLDDIDYVKLGDNKFQKTSRMLYFFEKYAGDISMRELETLSVPEMIKRVNYGEPINA